MRKIKTLVVGSALLALMTTSHAMAEESPQSLALQIALSTGLTDAKKGPLFDTRRSDLPEELQDVPNHYKFEDALDVGLYGTLGLLELGGSYTAWARGGSISPDMANLAFAGLGLLLHSPTNPHPATRPQIIAWMPAGPKGSRREERDARTAARDTMAAVVLNAAVGALPSSITPGEQQGRSTVVLSGIDECAEPPAKCLLYAVTYEPDRVIALDGTDSWHWKNWQAGDRRNDTRGTILTPGIWVQRKGTPYDQWQMPLTSERDYLVRFSSALPEWVWIYQPPNAEGPAAMLNQGGAHLFVEPLSANKQ